MEIGERLAKLVNILKISNVQVYTEMKISKQSFYKILNGATQYPSMEGILNLKSKYPNINLNWIISGIGDPILEGLDKDATVGSLLHMDPELLVQRVQAAEGMVKIMQKHLDDKEKLIQKLEEELKLLK